MRNSSSRKSGILPFISKTVFFLLKISKKCGIWPFWPKWCLVKEKERKKSSYSSFEIFCVGWGKFFVSILLVIKASIPKLVLDSVFELERNWRIVNLQLYFHHTRTRCCERLLHRLEMASFKQILLRMSDFIPAYMLHEWLF